LYDIKVYGKHLTTFTTLHYIIKGAMCKMFEYLLTEMQYDIHNYVFSGV